jgi:hypothetical protein
MTVFESVKAWLEEILSNPENGFEGVYWIDAEVLPANVRLQNAALYSSPNDMVTERLGGDHRHVDFKTLYFKKDFKEHEIRVSNEVFFEKLRSRIMEKNMEGIMPGDGREWVSIKHTGPAYPSQKQENLDEAIYQVNLRLEYIE